MYSRVTSLSLSLIPSVEAEASRKYEARKRVWGQKGGEGGGEVRCSLAEI